MRVRIFMAAIVFVVAPAMFATARVSVDQCVSRGRPPQDCRFVRLQIGEADTGAFGELIATARKRETAGVWGFISYTYRLTFDTGDRKDVAWLHVATDEVAWLDGDERFGNAVFTKSEVARLRKLLAPSAEVIVNRLPLEVTWNVAMKVDLDCDSVADQVFVGRDSAHYYVAAVIEPVRDSTVATYVAFLLDGMSQSSLCGDAIQLEEEPLETPPCRGLRLESGECDSFHLFWDREQKALDWWRL